MNTIYHIGTVGQPWGEAEKAQWLSEQQIKRSFFDDVLPAITALQNEFDVEQYGELNYQQVCGKTYPLYAVKSRNWQSDKPTILVTGGVHGYETSGVMGALRFVDQHGERYAGRVNWLVAPCVSPWGWERIQRWNHDAIDPNRSFRPGTTVQEAAALLALIAPLQGQFAAHIDLHETTDTDESEYRPAVAARDGKVFEPGSIPDGFYLVDDTENPQPAFQQAIIEAVGRVTHIAPPDEKNEIIGSPMTEPGVIRYEFKAWGLCASVTGARYTTTTEVYPDSPRATPEQCIAAQVAAVCAAVEFVCGAQ